MAKAEEFIPTRKSLLNRLKNLEDQESWLVFFETYWRLIHRTAIRAGLSETEAEEVVQETVIVMSKSLPKFNYDPAKGSFKNYLLKTTNWRIIAQLRKRMPMGELSSPAAGDTGADDIERFAVSVEPALEAIWDKEWEQNLLRAALQRVKRKTNAKLYQAFDLYVIQNWPATKVAKDLRMTRARVYIAKHLISKAIEREIIQLKTKGF